MKMPEKGLQHWLIVYYNRLIFCNFAPYCYLIEKINEKT